LEATLQRKKSEKYDHELELVVRKWLSQLLDESFDDSISFYDLLKDGEILCRYVPLPCGSWCLYCMTCSDAIVAVLSID
jgi:hypothetical protein